MAYNNAPSSDVLFTVKATVQSGEPFYLNFDIGENTILSTTAAASATPFALNWDGFLYYQTDTTPTDPHWLVPVLLPHGSYSEIWGLDSTVSI